jgi:transcriptional regulator with XRE-family HTH domain
MTKFINRIAEFRKKLGLTQEQLAEKIAEKTGESTHRVTIANLERGKQRLNQDWTRIIADALHTTPHDLMFNSPLSETVPIVGVVQAGKWVCDYAWDDKNHQDIIMPYNEQWSRHKKQACLVIGNSMNLLYPHGSTVVWIPFANIHPEQGKRYIVERIRNGEYEVTLKEFMQDNQNRKWLLPRSSDPLEQSPILIEPSDDEQIRIVGQVIWSSRIEE